ncbi:cell division control protein 48 [Phakopsora pachyrhizi]|nr:cell division control protein 48 [Phakopsora pachyrhizi]
MPMSTSQSNLPNPQRAGSIQFGQFAAAIKTTLDQAFSPSMRVKAGAWFSAYSKAFPKLLSFSPAILLMILGPLIKKKKALVLLAKALAIKFFPVPGGPNIRIPRVA